MYELVAEKYELECMNLLMSKSPLFLLFFMDQVFLLKIYFPNFFHS